MNTNTIDTNQLKAGIDTAQVIGEYVRLKRSGNNSTGLCPFHEEKTPSFTVYEDHFKCFGCGASGDVIEFVMRMEGVTFREAISQLGAEGVRGSSEGRSREAKAPKSARPPQSAAANRAWMLESEGWRWTAEKHFTDDLRQVRFENDEIQEGKGRPKKTFKWEHRADDCWLSTAGGKVPPIYFNNVAKESEKTDTLLGVEGWGKADIAGTLGIPSFSVKEVTEENASQFSDFALVTIWPDKDVAGLKMAASTAALIAKYTTVQVIDPPPELPEAGDIVDAVAMGWTARRIAELIAAAKNDWSAPIPLTSSAPKPFPPDLLPGAVGAFAEALAIHTETPRELADMMCLGVAATAVAGRCEVEIHQGYTEQLNLFVAAVLESGNRKTAVMNSARQPLTEFEREERERLEPELRQAISNRKTQEGRIEKLRKQVVDDPNGDAKKELDDLEQSLPTIPEFPRLWTQDITPEALAVLTAKNGERMAVLSDEGGYFEILAGRYSRGIPNLDFVLQAFTGTSVRVDRKSGEPLFLNKPLLTIALSPQPGVLSGLAQTPGFRTRGLLARFLIAILESNLGYRSLEPRPIPKQVHDDYSDAIFKLLKIPLQRDGDGRQIPIKLTFAPSAYDSWRKFQQMVEVEMREGNRLAGLKDWAGKLPGAAARVAGVFHCLTEDPQSIREISDDTMSRALAFASIMIPHALAAFTLMSSDGVAELAGKVLHFIVEKGSSEISVRDLFCAFQSSFGTMETLEPVLNLLADHQFIRVTEHRKTGGRPSKIVQVNPSVWRDKPC